MPSRWPAATPGLKCVLSPVCAFPAGLLLLPAATASAWLDLGLLVLIGYAGLRVAVLVLGWGLAGERRFAAVALAVLGLLGVGIALGVG